MIIINYIYDEILFNTMKAIKINYELRNQLKELYGQNISYDGLINRLIHDVADEMPILESNSSAVNINIYEDTMDKIKSYGLTNGESYENILIRMMIIAKDLYSNDE